MNFRLLCFSLAPVALATTLLSTTAHAQPDPFADYEAAKRGEPLGATASESAVQLPFEKRRWSLGLRTAFSYTGTSAGSVTGGAAESNTTFFYRVTPMVQYHIIDRLALGFSFGLLGKSIGREENSGGRTETSWLPEVSAHYILPVTKRFAFMPGLGLGLYFGGSDRKLQLAAGGPVVTESTSTFGGAMALYLNVGYQVAKHFQVRSGLGFFGSIGSESIDSVNRSVSTSAFNVTLPVEVFYTF